MASHATFAAVDWGTSSFRLWLMNSSGFVLEAIRSEEGMATAAGRGFSAILSHHLEALGAGPSLPVVICGMAGARQGWCEAPYLDVPTPLSAIAANSVAVPHQQRPVWILPGLAQRQPGAPDVMRGEETQLLGACAHGGDGLYCMPGTHSKWVRVRDGFVTGFSTFMTGEAYAVMAGHSILAHTIGQGGVEPDDPAFSEAVARAHADPATTTGLLFTIRAGGLLFDEPPETARARLSGYLIGAELAGSRCRAEAAPVRLVASGELARLYARALEVIGAPMQTIDAEESVRLGLAVAARKLALSKEATCA